MISRSRNRTTAWLGLIAMWLVVFAPIVSQMLLAQRADQPTAALCSVSQTTDLHQLHDAGPAPLHLGHDGAFGACGYCHLLEHHVAMPTLAALAAPSALPLAGTAPPTLSIRYVPLGAFPSGRPRGPPVVS